MAGVPAEKFSNAGTLPRLHNASRVVGVALTLGSNTPMRSSPATRSRKAPASRAAPTISRRYVSVCNPASSRMMKSGCWRAVSATAAKTFGGPKAISTSNCCRTS